MPKYKLVKKHEHIATYKRVLGGFADWYMLECGHIVARINTDMRREKCRCYACAGSPYSIPLFIGGAAQVLNNIWKSGAVPVIDSTQPAPDDSEE